MIEPKRHFKKPLELSPLVAIDRERCILCYRCVRFSQEVAEDYQLVFLERGDHTYVGTHDGHPYVAPFSGNIIELCPVGRADLDRLPLPRAAVGHRGGRVGLHRLRPASATSATRSATTTRCCACSRATTRRSTTAGSATRAASATSRSTRPSACTAPMVRDGGVLREVSWERALGEAAKALTRGGEKTAALAGGAVTNEEGCCWQRLLRDGLGSPHLDSRATGALDPCQARVLARPELTARVSDIDYADAVLVVEVEPVDEAPMLDLRMRKARRRHGARVITLTSRPSSLDDPGSELGADPGGDVAVRFAPGAAEAALAALGRLARARCAAYRAAPMVKRELRRIYRRNSASPAAVAELAAKAGADPGEIEAAAAALRAARFGDGDGKAGDVVVMWGERATVGERGAAAVDALLGRDRRAGDRRAARVRA